MKIHTNKNSIVYKDLSYQIIGLAMEAHGKLGFGFLEKVYENAMMVLFRREKIPAVQQSPIQVHFEGEIIGNYVPDILVDGKIILELKSVEKITNAHRVQVLNYLKATQKRLAIILNFAKKRLEYERLVLQWFAFATNAHEFARIKKLKKPLKNICKPSIVIISVNSC